MSSSKTLSTTIKIGALNNTAATFNKIASDVSRVERRMAQAQQRMRAMGASVAVGGAALTAAVTVPISRAVKSLYEYEVQMSETRNRLQAVLGKGLYDENGRSQWSALEADMKRVAKATPFTPHQIMQAQTFFAMAGMGAKSILGAMEPTAQLATALGTSLEYAADKVTNVASAMRMPMASVEEAKASVTSLAAAWATVAANANVSGEQMMQASELAAPIMSALGADVARTSAMIGGAGNVGIQGKHAGHVLAGIHSRFADLKPRGLAALERMNLKPESFLTGGRKLTGKDLESHLSKVVGFSESDIRKHRAKLEEIMSGSGSNFERANAARDYLTDSGAISNDERAAFAQSMSQFAYSGAGEFDMIEVLAKLHEQGASVADYNALFGLHMGKYAKAISSQTDRMRELEAMVNNDGVKNLQAMAAKMMEGLAGETGLFITQLGLLKDKINASGFATWMESGVRVGRGFLTFLTDLNAASWGTIGRFAKLAFVIGPVTMGLGAMLRLAAFAYSPFMALGKALSFAALRAAAFTASMSTLGTLRLLLSPIGLVAASVAGLGVALAYAVKDSPGMTRAFERVGMAFGKVKEAFTTGNFDLLNGAMNDIRIAALLFGESLGFVGKKWLENIVGPERFAAAMENLSSIMESIGNIFTNVKESVLGFFDGFAEGMGFSDGLKGELGALTDMLQSVTAWALQVTASFLKTGDNSKSLAQRAGELGKAFADFTKNSLIPLAGQVWYFVSYPFKQMHAAWVAFKDLLDSVFGSETWKSVERLFGLEAGTTVGAIDSITSSVETLTKALVSLSAASLFLLGPGKSFRMFKGAGGLFSKGLKGLGAAFGIGSGAAAGANVAPKAVKVTGAAGEAVGNGVAATALRFGWLRAINSALAGIAIYDKANQNAARARELMTRDDISEAEAMARVREENRKRFENSWFGRATESIGSPADWLGVSDGGPWSAIKSALTVSPSKAITNAPVGPKKPHYVQLIVDPYAEIELQERALEFHAAALARLSNKTAVSAALIKAHQARRAQPDHVGIGDMPAIRDAMANRRQLPDQMSEQAVSALNGAEAELSHLRGDFGKLLAAMSSGAIKSTIEGQANVNIRVHGNATATSTSSGDITTTLDLGGSDLTP